eukprot:10067430-Alexandrium_andersonii.AAC.1
MLCLSVLWCAALRYIDLQFPCHLCALRRSAVQHSAAPHSAADCSAAERSAVVLYRAALSWDAFH